MEFYLFLAFIFLYFLMSFFVKKNVLHKMWTSAFVISFAITAAVIGVMRVSTYGGAMSWGEFNSFYMLYLFGSMSVVLGIVNLWMYRSSIYKAFTKKEVCEVEVVIDDKLNDI